MLMLKLRPGSVLKAGTSANVNTFDDSCTFIAVSVITAFVPVLIWFEELQGVP